VPAKPQLPALYRSSSATPLLRGDVQAVDINRVIITQTLSVLFIEVRP